MKSTVKLSKIVRAKMLMGLLLAACFFTVVSCHQKKLVKSPAAVTEEAPETVFMKVDQMPEFPGGPMELRKFIASSVKYPVEAQKSKAQGKVFVSFVVSKTGSVTRAKIVRGVDPVLDAEAMRVVNSMPKWTPGKQKGKDVAVQYTIPINFVLQ